MKIVVVDNEQLPRESYLRLLRSLGYDDLAEFSSVEAAIEGLRSMEDPFVVLLDHDFGEGQAEGYTLCSWLRSRHPIGMLLPIVYLTGRLPPERYLDNERVRPFDGPSVYVSKTRVDEQLPELLKALFEQFELVRRTLDQQAARRALSKLSRNVYEEEIEEES